MDYSFGELSYQQKPLTTGAFENAVTILEDIGLPDLVAAWGKVQKVITENSGKKNAGKKFDLDLDLVSGATIKTLVSIGKVGALSKLWESLLTLSPDEAKEVPMAVGRSVLGDFFLLNADWLPISPTFSAALNLMRATRSVNYARFSRKHGKKTGRLINFFRFMRKLFPV